MTGSNTRFSRHPLRRPSSGGVSSRASQENIVLALAKFSLPLILSGILQQLYNWADAFVVGNVNGELALAAVGATSTAINFYLTAITGFTLGLSILFAQKYGSQKTHELSSILAAFSLLLGGIFLVLSLAGFFLTPVILRLLNTTPDTIAMAEDYLKIIFAGVPFMAVYNVYAAALRGIGNSRAPFFAVLVSSLVNVGLDLLLVAVLHWGVAGAAAATVLSQAAMTIFLVIYSVKKHPILRFSLREMSLNRSVLVQGIRLGIPPMIQSNVNASGNLVLQNFMNGFGSQTVAAITTAYRVDSIAILPMINLGSGISTMVAQSHGAGDEKKARKILFAGTSLMVIVSVVLTLLVIPSGGHLISLFGVSPQSAKIGSDFFRSLAGFYLLYGLSAAFRGYLEGKGDVIFSSTAGILALLCRIVLSYSLDSFLGNMVIAYAEGISWGFLFLMYFLRAIWKMRPERSRLQQTAF